MNLTKLIEAEAAKQTKVVMQKLVKDLVAATPIDTGNARAGWRIDGNSIVNDVEYIEELNRGHSKQAPSFFIEKTVLSQSGVKPNGAIVRSK